VPDTIPAASLNLDGGMGNGFIPYWGIEETSIRGVHIKLCHRRIIWQH
jgi:hypothetical protein